MTENIETNHKAPKFKITDRVRITKYKNVFSKGYAENWSRETFIIDSVLKTNPWNRRIKYLNGEKIIVNFNEKESLLKANPWNYKIKDLNRKKIIGNFYEKELLLSIL